MTDKIEMRGAKPLPLDRKLVTVTLRILPSAIEAIKARAVAEGIGEGEWKRRAIMGALEAGAMREVRKIEGSMKA